jgi:hypothetical protein
MITVEPAATTRPPSATSVNLEVGANHTLQVTAQPVTLPHHRMNEGLPLLADHDLPAQPFRASASLQTRHLPHSSETSDAKLSVSTAATVVTTSKGLPPLRLRCFSSELSSLVFPATMAAGGLAILLAHALGWARVDLPSGPVSLDRTSPNNNKSRH